jgi:pimeloyl-ACP methyl ester carboxylesterase
MGLAKEFARQPWNHLLYTGSPGVGREVMRAAAENVTGDIIPESGHWIMEENPRATVKRVRAFLDRR